MCEMSIHEKDLITGNTKLDAAIERIRFNCNGKKVLVAFSGGKDSQCCYHLAKEAGIDFTAQYSITRFEPPELIRFIRENYQDVTFRRAYKCSLVEDIRKRGLPNRWARWCCECKHAKTEGFDITVIGVRAEESPRRRETWRMFGRKQDGSAYVCPIFDWSTADVWEYLNERGVPHCCLYDLGWKRIGCVMCPLAQSNRKREFERYPKTVAMLKMGARMFVERMRRQGWVTKKGKECADWCRAEDPLEEFFTRWVESCQTQKPVAEMARTRTHDEPCLFAGTGFSESDGAEGGII